MPDQAVRDLETGYYVYGVVPALEDARPVLTGIDDAEVQFVEHEDVAAAVAEIALERPPGRRAELMAHSAVVEALSERGPVVPVQFGSVMEDVDSVVHDLLARDHDYYVDLLNACADSTSSGSKGPTCRTRCWPSWSRSVRTSRTCVGVRGTCRRA